MRGAGQVGTRLRCRISSSAAHAACPLCRAPRFGGASIASGPRTAPLGVRSRTALQRWVTGCIGRPALRGWSRRSISACHLSTDVPPGTEWVSNALDHAGTVALDLPSTVDADFILAFCAATADSRSKSFVAHFVPFMHPPATLGGSLNAEVANRQMPILSRTRCTAAFISHLHLVAFSRTGEPASHARCATPHQAGSFAFRIVMHPGALGEGPHAGYVAEPIRRDGRACSGQTARRSGR